MSMNIYKDAYENLMRLINARKEVMDNGVDTFEKALLSNKNLTKEEFEKEADKMMNNEEFLYYKHQRDCLNEILKWHFDDMKGS